MLAMTADGTGPATEIPAMQKARRFPVPPTTAFLTLAAQVELLRKAGAPESAIDKLVRRSILSTLAEDRESRRRPSAN